MRNLVPVKVKIGLKPNGHALYPNFNQLNEVMEKGMDWANYIDTLGEGWMYDKSSGHRDDTPDSPFGQQWGVLLVPKAFAEQAVVAFPEDCQELTEAETADFYDNKVAVDEPEEIIDTEVLTAIKVKQDLGLSLTPDQQDALDPKKPARGIRENPRKKWATHKASRKIEIVGTKG